jgi:hypothetical protein
LPSRPPGAPRPLLGHARHLEHLLPAHCMSVRRSAPSGGHPAWPRARSRGAPASHAPTRSHRTPSAGDSLEIGRGSPEIGRLWPRKEIRCLEFSSHQQCGGLNSSVRNSRICSIWRSDGGLLKKIGLTHFCRICSEHLFSPGTHGRAQNFLNRYSK